MADGLLLFNIKCAKKPFNGSVILPKQSYLRLNKKFSL